jgi:hypothetical protein
MLPDESVPTPSAAASTARYSSSDDFATANQDWVSGLKDIEGTFEGVLDMATGATFLADTGRTIIIYADRDDLPLWRHWWALFRQRFFDVPYPQMVVMTGRISETSTTTNDDETIVSGTFTRDGRLTID